MKQEFFNVDEFVGNINVSTNLNSILRRLMSKIILISNKNNSNCIITNGSIGSSLQDLPNMFLTKLTNGISVSDYKYCIGKLNGIDVFIDSRMRWDDKRIIFDDGLKFNRKNKLSKNSK